MKSMPAALCVLSLLVAAEAAAAPVRGFGPGYGVALLGQTALSFERDSDIVNAPGSCGRDAPYFYALRVEVSQNAAEIDYLAVTFGNGEAQRLPLRAHFGPGAGSRVIDLEGNARCIERFQVIGRTERPGFQAVVKLFGLHADPASRTLIGQTSLEFGRDRDLVRVPGECGPGAPRFFAIQVEVDKNAAEIDSIRVVFGNGTTQELDVRSRFPAWSQSRIIDLKGDVRCIERFKVTGRTERSGLQAVVKLFGVSWPAPPPRPVGAILGETRLRPASTDVDVIRVSDCRGDRANRFKAVQIEVRENFAEVDHLALRFGNGTFQDIPVRTYFNPGAWSRVIDLAGDGRCVSAIQVIGRTTAPGPQAVVTLRGY